METLMDRREQRFRVTVQREGIMNTLKPLTEREQQVLHGIYEGLTNKEIGTQVGVSESSVKATVQQLFRKNRVRTRAQLVRVALEGSLFGQRR